MHTLKILTLNCQKAYHPDLSQFFQKILKGETYDFLLLQEADSKVIDLIKSTTKAYHVLNPIDVQLDEHTHVAIVYKKEYELKDHQLLSFAKIDPKVPPRGRGFLSGTFSVNGQQILIGTTHLHPGFTTRNRIKEIRLIKGMIEGCHNIHSPVIIGGDFNSGIPGEIRRGEKVFGPALVRINKKLGVTLDSRFTEKTPFLITKIANFLAALGIAIKLRADHIYLDKETAKKHYTCRLLSDRVSDHLAMELIIE